MDKIGPISRGIFWRVGGDGVSEQVFIEIFVRGVVVVVVMWAGGGRKCFLSPINLGRSPGTRGNGSGFEGLMAIKAVGARKWLVALGTMHSTLVNGRRGSWDKIRIVMVEAARVGVVILALVMVAAPEFSIHLLVVVVMVNGRKWEVMMVVDKEW